MKTTTEPCSIAVGSNKLIYLAIKAFVLYGLYGIIPLFIIWTRTPTIKLTPYDWSYTVFSLALFLFVTALLLTLRRNSIARANSLLGLGPNNDQPPRYKGWKLVALGIICYSFFGSAIAFSYVMTADLVLRVLPIPSPFVIPATLAYTHKGLESRSHPCVIENKFETGYGEMTVCINSVKKNIAMPDHLEIGESVLLEGQSNSYIFVLNSVTSVN